MMLSDPIYGSFEVDEPVVAELLDSKAMRRLSKIGMYATRFPCVNFTDKISRLEHSIGVFLLLRKHGATIEEQIAGLIHDASHSAFSHLIDRVVYDDETLGASGEYGDKIRTRYIAESGIQEILEKHGFDPAYIVDDSHFMMKELPLPDVCADRLDYTLRDLLPGRNFDGWTTPEGVRVISDSLTVTDGRFAFKTLTSARRFARLYSYMDRTLWGSYDAAKLYHVLSRALRMAMGKGVLKFADLYEYGDEEVIDILRRAKDPEIEGLLSILDLPPAEFARYPFGDGKYVVKVRRVDPLFIDSGRARRYSERDKQYAASLASLPKFMAIQPAFCHKIAKAR
jgi:HD superfamily phosphohydrolase